MKAEENNNNTNAPTKHKCAECGVEFLVEEPEVWSFEKVITLKFNWCVPCAFEKRYGKRYSK